MTKRREANSGAELSADAEQRAVEAAIDAARAKLPPYAKEVVLIVAFAPAGEGPTELRRSSIVARGIDDETDLVEFLRFHAEDYFADSAG